MSSKLKLTFRHIHRLIRTGNACFSSDKPKYQKICLRNNPDGLSS